MAVDLLPPQHQPLVELVLCFRDRLYFSYPDARRFEHRFYTGPPDDPDSMRVSARTSRVDLYQAIDVEEAVYCQVGEHVFIAVRFVNAADGRWLWTNAKKDRQWWMHGDEDALAWRVA